MRDEELESFYITPTDTSILCVDIVDSCNLHCASCFRGNRYMKNRNKVMDYMLFTKIIDKAARLGIHSIELFNWTEPFLCTELPKYAAYIQEKGLTCHISSNLSLPDIPHLIPTLKHCEFLVVSVSGFTQDVYKINHRGGHIDFVKRNLEIISAAKKCGEIHLDIHIHYLIFDHSKEEFPLFKEFAEKHDFFIEPWRGLGLSGDQSFTSESSISQNNESTWCKKYLNFDSMTYPLVSKDHTAKHCLGAITPIPLDCEGNVFLCVFKPSIKKLCVGHFLDDDFDVLQYRRFAHPACTVCKGWYRDHPVIAQPYHKMSLLRGMLKSLGADEDFGTETIAEMADASRLAGKKVYFWGCGEMYKRKCHVFSECNPVCILVDTDTRPDSFLGLPVRHPDDIFPSGEALPVIIFAGKNAREKIIQTIRNKYPQLTEIYFCSSC